MDHPFNPRTFYEAALRLSASVTLTLPDDHFASLTSWLACDHLRTEDRETRNEDHSLDCMSGMLTLHTPHGAVVVRSDEPPFDLVTKDDADPEAAETARKFFRWYSTTIQDYTAQIIRSQAALASTPSVWVRSGSVPDSLGALEPGMLQSPDYGPIPFTVPEPIKLPPMNKEVFEAMTNSPIAKALQEYQTTEDESRAKVTEVDPETKSVTFREQDHPFWRGVAGAESHEDKYILRHIEAHQQMLDDERAKEQSPVKFTHENNFAYIPADFASSLPEEGSLLAINRPEACTRTHVLTADRGSIHLPADVVVHWCETDGPKEPKQLVFLTPGGVCPDCGHIDDFGHVGGKPMPVEQPFKRESGCEWNAGICDCGAVTVGTTHANWCSTRESP